jgi:uncharacterized protein (UPF0332 family)
MLNDATLLLSRAANDSAIDRAYYAVFHAAKAALEYAGSPESRTHAGLRSLFARSLVSSGIASVREGRSLARGFGLRQRATYSENNSSDAEAQEAVEAADSFVQVLRTAVLGVN